MTRKGWSQCGWTTTEERYLAHAAGSEPLCGICRKLKRSRASVKAKAHRMGVSLRVPVWGMSWCDSCATWRTSLSERTGRCRVCEMRERIAGREAACAEALAAMTPEQRRVYERTESARGSRKAMPPRPRKPGARAMGRSDAARAEKRWLAEMERWEYLREKRIYDAAKTRLRRMREATGSNPRKGDARTPGNN